MVKDEISRSLVEGKRFKNNKLNNKADQIVLDIF